MPRYKGFVFLLLCMNISLADVTGVAFCELEHSESQQHTLNVLKGYYGVERCEEVFAEASQKKGISFNGRNLRQMGTPITDITPICAMSHWQHLSIMEVEVDDFSCLATMPLKQLQFQNRGKPIDIAPISQIETLEAVYLTTKQLENFEMISQAIALEMADLSGPSIRDTRPLASLKNLKTLKLNSNPIEDYSGLSQLTQLRQLELGNTGMNDADLEHLRPLVNLGSLDLYKNNLTDISALEDLTNLWQLIISQNQIVDLSPLAGMKRLKVLKANDNQIEDITPISQLPSLDTIDINKNKLNDTSKLVQLPKLSWFVAIENPLYDCAPSSGNAATLKKGKLCTEADIERLSNPSFWQRFKNWLGMA